MNDRIKELIKLAGSINVNIGCDETVQVFDKQRFAELIIEHATECVRDVLRDEDSPLTYEATDMIQKRIKQYFGVK